MSRLIFLVIMSFPSLALAFPSGTYSASKGTIQIRAKGTRYHVAIETFEGQSSCSFFEDFQEYEEGHLSFSDQGCFVQIDQKANNAISVMAEGCSSSCGAGATLNFRKAVRN